MAELEYKTLKATLAQKAEGEPLHITGYGCAFGNVDSWGDVIEPKACDRYLASEDVARTRLCWQHDIAEIIGTITEMHADENGLRFEADLIDTARGKDAQECIKNGALNEFSIGYWVNNAHEDIIDGKTIRFLDDITIAEISLVSRAANPKAVITGVKSEDPEPAVSEPEPAAEPEAPAAEPEVTAEPEQKAEPEAPTTTTQTNENTNLQNKSEMEDINKNIEALDASVKAQQEELTALRNEMKASAKKQMGFKESLRAFLLEHKAEIEEGMKGRTAFEVKGATLASAITNDYSLSVQPDPTVYGANASTPFLVEFGIRPRTANKLSWIEAADTASVAYVAEGGTLSNQSSVAFEEKQRPYGKLATYVTISTEMSDWFEVLYDYVVNEGTRIVNAEANDEIWDGVGGTVGHTYEIHGLKGQSTAFSALAAGTVTSANIADVIIDAAEQIAKYGFNADKCFLTWAEFAQLRTVKDANGNWLYDAATGMIRGIKVIATNTLAAGEVFVCDSTCVQIYGGQSFELEFMRNGKIDGWDIYYRKAYQTKVPTAKQKGLIYVSSLATAIAALLPGDSANGGDL